MLQKEIGFMIREGTEGAVDGHFSNRKAKDEPAVKMVCRAINDRDLDRVTSLSLTTSMTFQLRVMQAVKDGSRDK